jgi:site-specific recombinase XerD
METLAVRQADNDVQVIAMWLHDKARHTQKAYANDIKKFLDFIGKSLNAITIGDIQSFMDSLADYSPASKARMAASIKSLFSFAKRIGYLPFDVASPIKVLKVKNTLNERILCEEDIQRMIILEEKPRDRALLRLLYIAGLRISEACNLKWLDIQPANNEGAYLNVFGKGDKTRSILVDQKTYNELLDLKGETGPDDPVFVSQKGNALSVPQAWRIVKRAAKRAKIDAPVSPHWFRHAHASHALDRGAPIHLVQATLGHASVATTGRYLHARPNDSSSLYLIA